MSRAIVFLLIIFPTIVNTMISGVGLVKFPFVVTLLGTIAIIAQSFIIVFIATWISSGKVIQIKLNSLINE